MPLWACGVVVRNHCRPGRAPAGLCHVYLPASVGQPTRQHLDSRWTIKSNKSSIMCFPCPLSPLTMLKGGAAHLVSLVRFILYHGRGVPLFNIVNGERGKGHIFSNRKLSLDAALFFCSILLSIYSTPGSGISDEFTPPHRQKYGPCLRQRERERRRVWM